MKLTNKENFELSLPYGAVNQNGNYPRSLDEVMHLSVTSAEINDQHRRILTVRLKDGKAINIEAKDEVSKQSLVIVEQKINRDLINRTLKEILETEYVASGKIN